MTAKPSFVAAVCAAVVAVMLGVTSLGFISVSSIPITTADSYTATGAGTITFGPYTYDFGGFRIQRDGHTGLFAKESGQPFFDVNSDVDVDMISNSDGSYFEVGTQVGGATMFAGVGGAAVSVTDGGDAHMMARSLDGSALDMGPTYNGVVLAGSNTVDVRALGTGGVILDGTDHGNVTVQGGTLIIPKRTTNPSPLVSGMVWMLDSGVTHEIRFYNGAAVYRIVGVTP